VDGEIKRGNPIGLEFQFFIKASFSEFESKCAPPRKKNHADFRGPSSNTEKKNQLVAFDSPYFQAVFLLQCLKPQEIFALAKGTGNKG